MPKDSIVSKHIIYELGIETVKILNKKQNELKNIKWTNGESNLDSEYSELACDCCEEAWDVIKTKYHEYDKIKINCKKPDINIKFTYSDGSSSNDKIELKSSKSKKMPGSTIKNLDINQVLIYCLRPSSESEIYKIKCSQYFSAMGESDIDLFQDRTPRPVINFEKMNNIDDTQHFVIHDKEGWIEHYAKCGLNRIQENSICQKSWQDDLVKIMKKKIIEEYIQNTSEEDFKIDKISLDIQSFSLGDPSAKKAPLTQNSSEEDIKIDNISLDIQSLSLGDPEKSQPLQDKNISNHNIVTKIDKNTIQPMDNNECVKRLTEHLVLSKVNHDEEIIRLPSLKHAHSYCIIYGLSAQQYGPLLEKYIRIKFNYIKNKAEDCYKDGKNSEVKVSMGGSKHLKFNFVQIRPSHDCDIYILTAYHLSFENVDSEGKLYIFKVPKEEMKKLIVSYGGYAHGTIKEHGKITVESLHDENNTKEYAIRPTINDSCWKSLLSFQVDEKDL